MVYLKVRIKNGEIFDGVRITSSILKPLNIKTKKKKISLDDRFKDYHGKNLAKEFSWDENVGKEI